MYVPIHTEGLYEGKKVGNADIENWNLRVVNLIDCKVQVLVTILGDTKYLSPVLPCLFYLRYRSWVLLRSIYPLFSHRHTELALFRKNGRNFAKS